MRFTRIASVLSALALAGAAALTGASSAQAAVAPVGPAAGTGYVALGDSYSSGLGAGSYDSGSGDCKRSTKAYPVLWKNAHAPASFDFVACSGAVTGDVLANQLGPLNANTGTVSITIGGNDAGFSDVMTTCILQSESTCVARVNEAKAFANNQLPGKLDQVYSAITGRAPSAHVVVLGYPRFYKLGGGCLAGLTETERAAINSGADVLNSVVAKRAADHGFTYADVTGNFSGHEICSSAPWLHSVNWTNIGESYHPTAAGQSGGYLPALNSAT
ncbi:SGNH/GDSL hydrolase family protein [Streptomyces sp. NA04227]|uniref:SGNH/GDSL hydrolase family protein n=1 Tax=Streptomyces sp. NA04227 TaxID=2742136 RepID=UPI00159242BC|nr:SGNH/GDSL hydrolase family protein [Streptomyces sp. NA04227]QKW05692.1 SGNH/GDSL hydrolase family protein [Streptomyces sp. NA04227]